ncbi:MAG TPA: alpha-amylase family glycosyl hydrolase [Acidimicrobiia bacterium]|nr:alpha-amylase family glycosyl hydrolase [Acidimicrobiia bacterium]
MNWWENAVGYEVYIRSFADSNDDGIGDFDGLTERLHHLAELGVDVVWVTPFYPSPQADFGYDVSDYTAIDAVYGDMAAFDRFQARAQELGLRVMIDLVPNHTSSQHHWFQKALADPASPERDYYIFRPAAPDGGPPNNWRSHFGGSAWTLDERSGEYYLHLFHRDQPDLDWSNPAVRDRFDAILGFWMDRGVDGFRVDVAHALMKDEELKDNPQILPLPDDATPNEAMAAFEHIHDHSQDSTKEIFARWKSLPGGADTFLLGEVYVLDVEKSASYMEIGGLDLCLFFGLNRRDWDAAGFMGEIRSWSLASKPGFAWTISSHDEKRPVTRFGGGDLGRARALSIWTLFCSLPGVPFMYQGEELGLEDGHVAPEHIQDPVGLAAYHESRDFARTPMPWDASENNGFTAGQPWIVSSPRPAEDTVAHQRSDPDSFFHLFQELLALRKRLGEQRQGGVEWLPTPSGIGLVLTGSVTTLANLTDEAAEVELPAGDWSLEFDTTRRQPEVHSGTVEIPPASARVYTATRPIP